MKRFDKFPLLTANLRIHKVFLRYAFLITVVAIGLDGFVLRYLKPDYVEPIWVRIGILLLFFGCFLTTFSPNWKRYSWAYVGVYLLFGLGANMVLFQNGWFDRMFFWLATGLVVWGYLVQGLRQLHVFYFSYLFISFVGLLISPNDPQTSIHFGTVLLLVAVLAYLITINLKLNYRRLQELNQRLTSSQKLLTKAQGIAQIGNWELDLSSLSIQLSPEMYHMYQLPTGIPISLDDIFQLYPHSSQSRLRQAIELCQKTGEPFDLKLEVFPRADNIRDVRIVGFREVKKGVPTRLYGLIQNITGEQMIQRRLQVAKEAAEEARDAKSQFLSVMSHEIRTPMNAVIGSAHLLAQENPRPDQQEHLHTLQHSAENLLSLINNILDFSKIEAGKVGLEKVPFPLVERLNQLKGMYQFQAKEKGIELQLQLPEKLPAWVIGDPVRFLQVLNNLLSNAVKFTEEGSVRLEVKLLEQTKAGQLMEFSVTDSGIGIAPEQLADIFHLFTQANSAITRKYGGTGLGLAISEKLVGLMGGQLLVESKLGSGSRFSFRIPLIATQAPAKAAPTASGEASPAPETVSVLLAEDNPVNVKIASKFLEKWGFEVTVAKDGIQALDAAENQAFDLILMDLQMPRMGGIEATKRLRELGVSIPILALSAEVSAGIQQQVLDAGMNDYTSKPFVPKDLKAKILHWVAAAI